MVVEYRYSWQNGRLVKTNHDGNVLSSTEIEPVSHNELSQLASPLTSITHSHPNPDAMEDENMSIATGEASPTIDGNTNGEARSPEKPTLTTDDLEKRDREAVAYSKALLVEGDTLVYITYPGDSKCFDSTGFEISAAPHRVHSSRLLATGSKFFAELLLSSTNQYRVVRRKKLVGNLPTGIKYVLDLTPPDEGDEAVQLTSELSCSLGIRLWHTAAQRCGISHNLVGGEDEIMDSRNVTSYGALTAAPLLNAPEFGMRTLRSVSNQAVGVNPQPTSFESLETLQQNRDIEDAVRISLEELSKSTAQKAAKKDPTNVPEYCPIRHRAGIGRLLRVLEGKNPRLDSAPKVWTLFVLAKYFDCTAAVVDWIVSWVIADPNTQFIEILPEASCKIAFGLKNQMICRAAFSILVSEEALSLASREAGHLDADRNRTNQFGRVREDIDEDIRTRIEYASKHFASRVCKTFEALADEEMSWLTQLPEYQKLQKFKNDVLTCVDNKEQPSKWLCAIDQLSFDLRTYVRSQIMVCLSSGLNHEQVNTANNHRRAERYTNFGTSFKSEGTFSLLYGKLLDKERIFVRFFWLHLLYIDFPTCFYGAVPSDSDPKFRELYLSGVRPSISTLFNSQKVLNESILESINEGLSNNGIMPSETLPDYTETYDAGNYDVQNTSNTSHSRVPISRVNDLETFQTTKSWNPFFVFKSGAPSGAASKTNEDDWRDDWIKPRTEYDWDALTTNDGDGETEPLIPREAGGSNATIPKFRRGTGSATLGAMDADEYLAQHHLLDPQSGLVQTATSDKGTLSTNSGLPLRPKTLATISPAQNLAMGLSEKEHASGDVAEFFKAQSSKGGIWMRDTDTSSGQILNKHRARSDADSSLSRTMWKSQYEHTVAKTYTALPPIVKPAPKPRVPRDNNISSNSPFFNMSQLFLEAKDHIRNVATKMLDQREMGFDIALTDTLLSLGQEEFKYLPLWAGGDDDGTGGVFDDTIPFPLAGPNGPGPSFHTGFSSASAASSEFDTMSDRTAFNTSVAVEDGFSDHIDRRIVVADDDFHSETFSEDSEVYDRKGKGVDRSGFYTSAPVSEAAFSMADTTPVDSETLGVDSNVEIEYEEEDSDADTTIGQADDEDEDETWDGGDTESFDFGDSDEEMANS